MTYRETIDFLFQQLPMYQRIGGAAYKANLDATEAMMDMLDHPERGFKSVHVAGTNGKGSVSHLLAAVMQSAGYKVGLYTSPHLLDFRERIKVNGETISETAVTHFVKQNQGLFESVRPSFFEWTVALAFEFFRQESVDIAIVEVGMGGRLDSTNVVTPELAVITNIGLDHQQFLGDTLGKIAAEKAGIMKKGVTTVIGRSQRETEGVFRKQALMLDAPITFADQEFPDNIPSSGLVGVYQKENIQTAYIALEKLRNAGWEIHELDIAKGFRDVQLLTGLRGRWEQLQTDPKVICDVAHNLEGMERIFEQLTSTPYHDLHLVLGFVDDKAVDSILKLIPSDAMVYLCEADIPRAMPIHRLSQKAQDADIPNQSFGTVHEAFAAALEAAHKDDLVFVGGSTFVVADLLKHLQPATS